MHLPDLIATIPPELRDYIRDSEEPLETTLRRVIREEVHRAS